MFRIQNLILLLLLISCSTPQTEHTNFKGERSLAAVPADCSALISKFLAEAENFNQAAFQKKLAKYGYQIKGDSLYRKNRRLASVEVISPRYLFEWQDQDFHDEWIANGGVLKDEMDFILSEHGQAYGRGFYVSLDPFDSQSYGSHLTIFKVDKPLMLISDPTGGVEEQETILNELRKIGFAGIKGTHTWLSIFNEDFLSQAVRIDQNIVNYIQKTFSVNSQNDLTLYGQMYLAKRKISPEKIIDAALKFSNLTYAGINPSLLVYAMKNMSPAQLNRTIKNDPADFFLAQYSLAFQANGKLEDEDYKIIIKILQNSSKNFKEINTSQDFLKEVVSRMSRTQFNQIANKAEAPVFLKLYSQLLASGKAISEDEYANIIDAFLNLTHNHHDAVTPEMLKKILSKMDYSQFDTLVGKTRVDFFYSAIKNYEHSESFFALFDLFDVATIGKIKTDESLNLQDMMELAKKYEEATAKIDLKKIKTSSDFKKLLKNVFELDYETRSNDVIMTPYLNNKYTIKISNKSYDYIKENKLLNLSEEKKLPDSSVDLMVSYMELKNLETLKPLFTDDEYDAIQNLKNSDKEAAALKLMINKLLEKFFDRQYHPKITSLLFNQPSGAAINLYDAFVSLHPFTDGNGRAARLYLNWVMENMETSPSNFLNEADILLPRINPLDYQAMQNHTKSLAASKLWVISAESEEEMIERARLALKKNPKYIEILSELHYLKNRLK